MTVVAILTILGSVATARVASQRERAATSAVLATVDAIFRAADNFRVEHGDWPPNVHAGETSPVFEGLMRRSPIGRPTPIGGTYDWNGTGTTAPTIGVYVNGGSIDDWQRIDDAGDDGSLSSGKIYERVGLLAFDLASAQ